jgi:hypothetical protein
VAVVAPLLPRLPRVVIAALLPPPLPRVAAVEVPPPLLRLAVEVIPVAVVAAELADCKSIQRTEFAAPPYCCSTDAASRSVTTVGGKPFLATAPECDSRAVAAGSRDEGGGIDDC